jgi:hypothetical protein
MPRVEAFDGVAVRGDQLTHSFRVLPEPGCLGFGRGHGLACELEQHRIEAYLERGEGLGALASLATVHVAVGVQAGLAQGVAAFRKAAALVRVSAHTAAHSRLDLTEKLLMP